MSIVQEVNSLLEVWQSEKVEKIQVEVFSAPEKPSELVTYVLSIEGPVDVYCFYEGVRGLPVRGARFLKEKIFFPIYAEKRDIKFLLYSLKGWDFKKCVLSMPKQTALGDMINRINRSALEGLSSLDFFRYCVQGSRKNALYSYIQQELPKKNWLFDLSIKQRELGKKVIDFFDQQSNVFDCVQDLDVARAYSCMQYIEGYYLIKKSVERGLAQGRKTIEVVFAMPNDESKYYEDFPKDIPEMLKKDFGIALQGVAVKITMRSFLYGGAFSDRPYIDTNFRASYIKTRNILPYFDFLKNQDEVRKVCLRDEIHKLND